MQPTKWDSKAKRTSKRLSKRGKVALLERYEVEMQRGRNRENILEDMADEIGVSSQRQVERILAQAATYEQEIENHFAELSSIALTIANNLSKYRNTAPNCFRGSDKIGDLVYGGFICVLGEQSIALQRIDRSIALNLLAHLQKEFSELDEVTDWDCLTNSQITEALILRLNRKGYKGSFKGKCPACPR